MTKRTSHPSQKPKPTQSRVGLWSRVGVVHHFSKLVFGLGVLLIIGALLATTSFMSDFILRQMNQIPISLNPVAAENHQQLVQAATITARNQAVAARNQAKIVATVGWSSALSAALLSPSSSPDQQYHALIQPADIQQTGRRHRQALLENRLSHATQAEQDKARQLAYEPFTTAVDSDENQALSPQAIVDGADANAQAIVVLGGGLGHDAQGRIVPNEFSQLRLLQAISQHHATGLPILLSGVEAPYMQAWLKQHGEEAQWLEARSMNTCENARFSALLLQQLGGAPRVELVTDVWHIPRARWLFAMNGIETIAVPVPLPNDPAPWWPNWRNLAHTRRALHELVAYSRDRWFGVVGCREVP